ncbi:MAG: lactate dehydrogenase [Betaproteobacteria bacterium]|nr:lactate dehydrogenase [Betaproteobacteria bacterium]
MHTETESQPARFDAEALTAFAERLLTAAAMPPDRARDVAGVLVEADLLGHDTHGLELLPTYLADIEAGRMTVTGEPSIIADRPAVLTWDGHRLPGPWLVLRAVEEASARAKIYGTGTVSIRRSYHIACLAVYARRVAEDGLVLLLHTSAPAGSSVAPYGGTRALFSPSPMAMGIPTGGQAILVDISTSLTTNSLTGRLHREGKKLSSPWLIDETGAPTDDPAVLFAPRTGTILPIGGVDAGHKGYGLSLMVEALTAGLAGHGRSDPGARMGGTIFVQVLDPAAFSGLDAFREQMDWIAAACRSNPPARGVDRVRLPGERGLFLRAEQLRSGVGIKPAVVDALSNAAAKLGVATPARLQSRHGHDQHPAPGL